MSVPEQMFLTFGKDAIGEEQSWIEINLTCSVNDGEFPPLSYQVTYTYATEVPAIIMLTFQFSIFSQFGA